MILETIPTQKFSILITDYPDDCPCFNGVLCVNRHHATITATSQRRVGDTVNSVQVDWLQDLNSEHGTFVNEVGKN